MSYFKGISGVGRVRASLWPHIFGLSCLCLEARLHKDRCIRRGPGRAPRGRGGAVAPVMVCLSRGSTERAQQSVAPPSGFCFVVSGKIKGALQPEKLQHPGGGQGHSPPAESFMGGLTSTVLLVPLWNSDKTSVRGGITKGGFPVE